MWNASAKNQLDAETRFSYSKARIMAGGQRAPGGASSRKAMGDLYGADLDAEVESVLSPARDKSPERVHRPQRQENSANRKIFSALKKKQDEERSSILWKLWLHTFMPNEQPRKGWDLWILSLVLFSSLRVPYVCAFIPGDPDPAELPTMGLIDWVVDAMFYLDMILNFWTGYEEGHLVVKEKGDIAMNYLMGAPVVQRSSPALLLALSTHIWYQLSQASSGSTSSPLWNGIFSFWPWYV